MKNKAQHLQYNFDLKNLLILLISMNYPVPHSHKTFELGGVIIDSNFDSGNLFNAERPSSMMFNLWIAVDHQKNQYRTWFHFSLVGLKKGSQPIFRICNMQNQSKLLNEGLVPVFREQNSEQWKRIVHKVDTARIEHNQGWIQWSFKHTMTSDSKVFFAFFYPWSNLQNDLFLKRIEEKCKAQTDLYFKRSTIIKSMEGRPVQFITISSKRGLSSKNENFGDENLFPDGGQPKQFLVDKKAFVISARVHPGEVPSSHVMTGIIEQLTEDTDSARLLRDKFTFYLFPILNPDGVARGHYRVDTNGINLNRCYINPNPRTHSPIYAVKKTIMHFHNKGKYFGFLDLHAHAARKGVFIYGNSTDELEKQTLICLFPKILSMNSEIFEYQGSNFTQKNMYCKDINDHVSKQGAGRVAIFKATKNPYSWTLQCNYNSSRVINTLEQRIKQSEKVIKISQKQLDSQLIINYRYPNPKEPKQFYTIATFRKLGKQICQSLLDLIELNPLSRIDNPANHFKCVQNLKMNLAVALLRMAPNRFQSPYRRLYHYMEGPSSTEQLAQRSVKALYLLLIKKAKIQNMNGFLKDNDDSSIILPAKPKGLSSSPVRVNSPSKVQRVHLKPGSKELSIRVSSYSPNSRKKSEPEPQETTQTSQTFGLLKLTKIQSQLKMDTDESGEQQPSSFPEVYHSLQSTTSEQTDSQKQGVKLENLKFGPIVSFHLSGVQGNYQRLAPRNHQGLDILRTYRNSHNSDFKKINQLQTNIKMGKSTFQQLPSLGSSKIKAMVSISSIGNEIKILRRPTKNNKNIFLVGND